MMIEFAAPYTAADGKTFKADQAADIESEEALRLLADGLARIAQPAPVKTAEKG